MKMHIAHEDSSGLSDCNSIAEIAAEPSDTKSMS